MKTKNPLSIGTSKCLGTLLTAMLALCTPLAMAQTASFRHLPGVTGITGASRDGRVLCGHFGSHSAVRIVDGVITHLPRRTANATVTGATGISADGRVIAGYSGDPAPVPALVRWVEGGAAQALGSLPGLTNTPEIGAISEDGSVIAGIARDATFPTGQLFRWTQAGGIVALGVPPGASAPTIRGMSADGVTLCGNSRVPHPSISHFQMQKGWRWTSSGGLAELPALAGDNYTQVAAVLSDGSAFGFSSYIGVDGSSARPDGSGSSAIEVRWDAAGTVSRLPLPAGVTYANALVASSDGAAVLGLAHPGQVVRWTSSGAAVLGSGASDMVFGATDGSALYGGGNLWDAENGMRDLKSVLLESYGVESIRRWTDFARPVLLRRVGDTLIIAGMARTPDVGDAQDRRGSVGAWLAHIPLPSGGQPDPFGGDMLAPTAAFRPSASFREHYEETPIVYRDPPEDIGDGILMPGQLHREAGGKWTAVIAATGSIAGLDLATLSAATPVRLRLGEFYFSKTLGQSTDWAPGRTRATFTLDRGRLTVLWNARTVTFTASSSASDRLVRDNDPQLGVSYYVGRFQQGFIDWIAYQKYFGGAVSSNPNRDEFLRLAVGFADRTGARPLVLSGRRTERPMPGSGSGDVFRNLRTVVVAGAADYTPPVVAYISPAEKGVVFGPELSVRVRCSRVAAIEVRVNGGPWTTRNIGGYFTGEWEFRQLPLVPGANVIEIKAADMSGNESAPLRRTVTYSTIEGDYSALVHVDGADGEVAGYFKLSLARARTFSGRLTIGGGTHAFRGALALDGSATVQVARGRLAPITLHLQTTVPADGRTTLAVAFTLDGTDHAIDAGRAKLFAALGAWAVVLPPDATALADSTLPRGSGFGVLDIAASGAARLVGRVADGTPFSFAGTVDWRGRFPLHLPLKYGRATGLLAGLIDLNPPVPSASWLGGEVAWQKPAQAGAGRFARDFTLSSAVVGGPVAFVPLFGGPSAATPAGTARVSADATVLVEKSLELRGTQPVVTTPAADKLSLRFARGLVTGSVLLPGHARAASLFGVAYTAADGSMSTRGFCLSATTSDDFRLIPNP